MKPSPVLETLRNIAGQYVAGGHHIGKMRNALITGAARGIGAAFVQLPISARRPSSHSNVGLRALNNVTKAISVAPTA